MIEKLNSSVNILALVIVAFGLAFAHMHEHEIASNLISGAIGLMGGKALVAASKQDGHDKPAL